MSQWMFNATHAVTHYFLYGLFYSFAREEASVICTSRMKVCVFFACV